MIPYSVRMATTGDFLPTGSMILAERLEPSAIHMANMTKSARALAILEYPASSTEEVIPLFE